MNIFPTISTNPDYGLNEQVTFSTNNVQFGDGYEQRSVKGLNSKPKSWMLRWSALVPDEFNTVYQFLSDSNGVYSFSWTHPLTGIAYTVVCDQLSYTVNHYGLYNLQVRFREVYN